MSVEKEAEGVMNAFANAFVGMGKIFERKDKQWVALYAHLEARGMNGVVKQRRQGDDALEFSHDGVEYKMAITKLEEWVRTTRPDLMWWTPLGSNAMTERPVINNGRPIIKLD
jgi:hypothetical protein